MQVVVSSLLSKKTLEWHVCTESMSNAVTLDILLVTRKLKSQFLYLPKCEEGLRDKKQHIIIV